MSEHNTMLQPVAFALAIGLLFVSGCSQPDAAEFASANPESVGRTACISCHEQQATLFTDSHHDLAMQPLDSTTAVAALDGGSFEYNGVVTTFNRSGSEFTVETDGPDGRLQTFDLKYTFGIDPLVQYLVDMPGGRLQSLGVSWDSRPDSAGGQRFFHVYEGQRVDYTDRLHWTAPDQTWNYQCAECHSTGLRKNFDLASLTYNTTWDEIDVSCEACHGPGSTHIDWAQSEDRDPVSDPYAQAAVSLPNDRVWIRHPDSSVARLREPFDSRQADVCARCHARRGVVNDLYVADTPFLDTHRPSLLDEALYHPDGQIDDEVYVYGSFLQSKMAAEGVVCSDCHEPHSLELKAPGNLMCGQCHSPAVYDDPSHTFHESATAGSQCVDCHMPSKTYMVVDPRRDHSFRVPRPDLSVKLGVPNACNECHTDQSAQWAQDAVEAWYPNGRSFEDHFALAIAAGRANQPASDIALLEVARPGNPGIVRATALSLLSRTGVNDDPHVSIVRGGIADDDGLVRMGAIRALETARPEIRRGLATAGLDDPLLTVRIEAARILAPVAGTLSPALRSRFDSVATEYVASQLVNADRHEAHLNLGLFYQQLGRIDEAEASYRNAMAVDPRAVEARINLADLYRQLDREPEAETELLAALEIDPDNAATQHALGLAYVRAQRIDEAMPLLGSAAEGAPQAARYAYVYAVALNSTGSRAKAIAVAEQALETHPYEIPLIELLVALYRDQGDAVRSGEYLQRLQELAPS